MPVEIRKERVDVAKGATTTDRRSVAVERSPQGAASSRKMEASRTTTTRRTAPRGRSPSTSTSTSLSRTSSASDASSSQSDTSTDSTASSDSRRHQQQQQPMRRDSGRQLETRRESWKDTAASLRRDQQHQYVHVLDKNLRVPAVDHLAGTRARLRHPDMNPEDAMAAEDRAALFGDTKSDLRSAAGSIQESVEDVVGGAVNVMGRAGRAAAATAGHAASAVKHGVTGMAHGVMDAGRAVTRAAKGPPVPDVRGAYDDKPHHRHRHHHRDHDRDFPAQPAARRTPGQDSGGATTGTTTATTTTSARSAPRPPPKAAAAAGDGAVPQLPGVDMQAGRRDQRRHPRLDKEDAMAEGDKEALRTLGRRVQHGGDEAADTVTRWRKGVADHLSGVADQMSGAVNDTRRRMADEDERQRRVQRDDRRERERRQPAAALAAAEGHFHNAAASARDFASSAVDVDAGRRAQRLHPQMDKEDAMAAEDRAAVDRARSAVLDSSLVREARILGRKVKQRAEVATDIVRHSISPHVSRTHEDGAHEDDAAISSVVKHARQRYATTAHEAADEADADAAAFKDHARNLADAVRRDMRRRGELAEGQIVDVTIHAKVSTRPPNAPAFSHWPPPSPADTNASSQHHLTRSVHLQDPTHLQEPPLDPVMILPAHMPGADATPRSTPAQTPSGASGGGSPAVVAAAARPESSSGSNRGRVTGFLSRVAHLPGKLLTRGRSSSRSPAAERTPSVGAAAAPPPPAPPTPPAPATPPLAQQRPAAQLERPIAATAEDADLFTPATSPDALPQHRPFPTPRRQQQEGQMRLPSSLRAAAAAGAPAGSPSAREVLEAADELVQAGLHAVLSPMSIAETTPDEAFYPPGAGRRARVAALETAESLGRAMLLEAEEAALRRFVFATAKAAYATGTDEGGQLGDIVFHWLEVTMAHNQGCRHKLCSRRTAHRHHDAVVARVATRHSAEASAGHAAAHTRHARAMLSSASTSSSGCTSSTWTSSWSSSQSRSSYDSTSFSDTTTASDEGDRRASQGGAHRRLQGAATAEREARAHAESDMRAVEEARRAAVRVIRNADANVQKKAREVVTSIAETKAQLQVAAVQRKLHAVEAVGGAANTLREVKDDAQVKVNAAQADLSASPSSQSPVEARPARQAAAQAHHQRRRADVKAVEQRRYSEPKNVTAAATGRSQTGHSQAATGQEHQRAADARAAVSGSTTSSMDSDMSASPPYRPPRVSAAIVPRVFADDHTNNAAGMPAHVMAGNAAHMPHGFAGSTFQSTMTQQSPRPLLDLDAGIAGKSLNLTSLDPALVTHTHHPSTNATPMMHQPQASGNSTPGAPATTTTTVLTTTQQTTRVIPVPPLPKKKKHGGLKLTLGKKH